MSKPDYRRIAKPNALRKRLAFRIDRIRPYWLDPPLTWLACKVIGHEPMNDPQYSNEAWCGWCRP